MTQYYYTVSTLPFLTYETEGQMEPEDFLEMCGDWLTPGDQKVLSSCSLTDFPGKSPSFALSSWARWERSLRNELVKLRAPKRGVEPETYLKPGEEILESAEIARNAFALDSALSAEDLLDRERWIFLDNQERGHYFDLEKLIVYYLKLQLLKRKQKFSVEQGKNQFAKAYETITGTMRENL